VDRHGRQPTYLGPNDAFHVVPLSGHDRGRVQQFLSVPVGAEACGPELTPDERTLFCAVQHPGEGSTVERPSSSWPDRSSPPRPSLIPSPRPIGAEETASATDRGVRCGAAPR
jgi:hypothetical protein